MFDAELHHIGQYSRHVYSVTTMGLFGIPRVKNIPQNSAQEVVSFGCNRYIVLKIQLHTMTWNHTLPHEYGASRYGMLHHGASWCVIVRHCASLCVMVRHGASWCVMVCHKDKEWDSPFSCAESEATSRYPGSGTCSPCGWEAVRIAGISANITCTIHCHTTHCNVLNRRHNAIICPDLS